MMRIFLCITCLSIGAFLFSCKTTRMDIAVPDKKEEESRIYEVPEIVHEVKKTQEKYSIEEEAQPTQAEEPAEKPAEEPVELQPSGTDIHEKEDELIVRRYLQSMTLEERVGQRFISKIEGSEFSDRIVSLIHDEHIGGIILYPWNVQDVQQVKNLTETVQRTADQNNPPIPLFICVDQEGGRVNAFKLREISQLSPPFFWAQHNDHFFVEAAAYIICSEISKLGCNMNFAPVLDLYGRPDKTIIGDRSMGKDPVTIGTFGISYMEGAKKAGVIPVVKHFPGHGSSTVDSHHSLPVVEKDESALRDQDFKPFQMAIESGVDAIMTAHVLFNQIDPEYPVTLSSRILRGILREQFGFQGIVISDGMSMGALSNNFEITETLKLMFKAGVDLILVHHKYNLSDLKRIVYELYEQGEITQREINEGVERILKIKLKYGLISKDPVYLQSDDSPSVPDLN